MTPAQVAKLPRKKLEAKVVYALATFHELYQTVHGHPARGGMSSILIKLRDAIARMEAP